MLFLLFFISASYFILLITTEQKSFPFLTNKVESEIKQYLEQHDDIRIKNIRIKQKNFNIIAHFDQINLTYSKIFVDIPTAKLSFSIFDLILFQTSIKEMDIDLANVKYHSYLSDKSDDNFNFKLNDILPEILSSNLKKAKINRLNLKLLNEGKIYHDIKINDAALKISNERSFLSAKIKFKNKNLTLKNRCYIDAAAICNINISKFDPSLISNFYSIPLDISGIRAKISSNITIISNDKSDNISFIFNSDKGVINDRRIFSDRVQFDDLRISGDYNLDQKSLKITDFNLKFDNDITFSGNLNIQNVFKPKFNVNLSLDNLTRKDTSKLWPIIIPEDDNIKKWVLKHMKSFDIEKSNIFMQFDQGNMVDIDAKFNFKNAAILYDRYFPTIYDASGRAHFDNKSMKIEIDKGNVLKSKIKNATIIIADFFKKTLILEIKSKVIGRAEDLLKHINYKSDFARNIGNYVNGFSNSYIDLAIPIEQKLNLKDIYLQIHSRVRNINNNYLCKNSYLHIDVTKDVNSDVFSSKINLTGSNINFAPLSIAKNKNIKSQLSFDIESKNNLLKFDNLKFNLLQDNLITGSFLFNLDYKSVQNINLKHLDFALSYNSDYKNSTRELIINAKKIDLNKLKSIITSSNSDHKKYDINNVEIILDDLILVNDIKFHDVDINLHCNKSLCINSFIEVKKDNKEIVNIDFKPYPIKQITKISGKISDISSVVRGFDIYDKILEGDLAIEAEIKMDDQDAIISCEAYNKKEYQILKGEMVEKISKDDFFSKIRDKLALEDKVRFDDLHSEFNIRDGVLELEKFIISNNYLGITAKGDINIIAGKVDIKGLVVPGYLINRLFGIGDLPIIKYFSPLLVGEEGGGIFAGSYKLEKNPDIDNKLRFQLNKSSIFAPGAIRNFFN